MTPERNAKLRSVLDKRQPDLTVLTDSVHKGRNLSAIVRTCDAVGIGKMHCVIPDKEYKSFKGTAKGSHRYVEVERHLALNSALEQFKQQGFQCIGAHVDETGHKTVDFRSIDYTLPTVVVMGAEKQGLSTQSQSLCDAFVSIPMSGMVESYNVSVACALILSEAQRQKQLAGHYDSVKLSQEEYDRLLFEWAHPQVKLFCQRYKLEYPALQEDGEIIEPAQWYKQAREQISRDKQAKKQAKAVAK